jgi:hypothetical protein
VSRASAAHQRIPALALAMLAAALILALSAGSALAADAFGRRAIADIQRVYGPFVGTLGQR